MLVLVLLCVGLHYVYTTWADEHQEVSEEESKENAAELFAKFDLDGKGISKQEVTKIVKRIAHEVTDSEIDDLFARADEDGSGAIDFDEFYSAAYGNDGDTSSAAGESEDAAAVSGEGEASSAAPAFVFDLAGLVKKKRAADRRTEVLTVLFVAIFLL
jgi:hypothetical protein